MEPAVVFRNKMRAITLLCSMTVAIVSTEQSSQNAGLLDKLNHQVQQQEARLQQQQEEIQQLNMKTQQQEDKIQLQRFEIRQQNDQIQQQNNKMRQQEDKLQQQEETIGMLLQMMKANRESIEQLEKRLEQEYSEKISLNSVSPADISEEHRSKRSDDPDPLEIVVSHMSQRLNDVTAEIQSLKNQDESLRTTINDGLVEAKGSVYTRWGSSSCGNTSDLVYTGVMGGSLYYHTGGASNPLCLPLHPVYAGNIHMGVSAGNAALYGAEYEMSPEAAHNLDAVCAVCRTARASTVMIPATNVCSPGWALEYSGYIMASRPDDGRVGTEYICVDSRLEGRAGTTANDDGFLLYYTKGHCGSLPALPIRRVMWSSALFAPNKDEKYSCS